VSVCASDDVAVKPIPDTLRVESHAICRKATSAAPVEAHCGIPGRLAQLRSGMTRREAHEILGLKKSWIRGGLGATFSGGGRSGWMEYESFYVRAPRVVAIKNEGGPSRVLTSSGMIRLVYHRDPRSTSRSADDESARLARASFSVDGQTIAEMPMSP
jgi:hypothetical protein